MKKFLSIALVLMLLVSCFALSGCKDDESKMVDDGAGVTIATEVNTAPVYNVGDLTGKTLKIGAIMVGDETEGYTEAHMEGINTAIEKVKAAGATVSIVWKKKVGEDSACAQAANELVSAGCNLIITNSYGHQFQTGDVIANNPTVTFISMTGDLAAASAATNDKNAFTDVYESRYVSGVVAGLKLKQLVEDGLVADKNKDADGNIKIGYVGAYNYAEVVSGYTAFYLGIKSVVSNVAMKVQYTNEWFHYEKEYQTAKSLIADGCIIIGQHADSEGAPTACEEAYLAGTRVYSIGYNVDMLEAAPHAALTSATNTWAVYYAYAFATALKGETIVTDWAKGYNDGAVAITAINGKVFKTDPSAEVKAVVDSIKAGTLKVFDTSKFTVKGVKVTTTVGHADMGVWNGTSVDPCTYNYIKTEGDVSYFSESTRISAPTFALRIDGITEVAAAE